MLGNGNVKQRGEGEGDWAWGREVLVERYIPGREITVAVMGDRALGVTELRPTVGFYDYEAKYKREDTQYLFEINLTASLLSKLKDMALKAHAVLGCRHLSRVDFIVDEDDDPWIIEVNTIPGFTRHSLLPMAAVQAGMSPPQLYDRLARLPLREERGEGPKEQET